MDPFHRGRGARGRRVGALAALTLGGLLAAAPSALGQAAVDANANVARGVLTVTATDPDRAVDLVLEPSNNLVRISSETPGSVNAGIGCLQDGAAAVCGGVTSIEASGTPLGDEIRNNTEVRSTLSGGDGDDRLSAGAADDVIDAGGGDDESFGGAGDDQFPATDGRDRMFGGDGVDTTDYSARTAPVVVSLDGLTNDGALGEGDQVDVENVTGGSGPDTLKGSNTGNLLDGAAGNDKLEGNGGDDTLLGRGGNDGLEAGAGDDALDSGEGNDSLTPGLGVDDVRGGSAFDSVLYTERSTRVFVTLDDAANDGAVTFVSNDGLAFAGSEGDNVHSDVEGASSGAGNDVLVGSAAANTLDGGPGDDSLDGKTGPDQIQGGAGSNQVSYAGRTLGVTVKLDNLANDGDATDGPVGARDNVQGVRNVRGGNGPDTIVGSGDGNVLAGGPGDDDITGLGSADVLRGEAGADVVHANDGVKDTVDCGAGADEAELDLLDAPVVNGVRLVPATCETAIIVPVGELPGLAILSRALRTRDGIAHVRLRCPRAVKSNGCTGRLRLFAPKRPRKALASASYRLRRGGKATVELRLRRTGARTLVALAAGRGPTGRPHVSVRRLTVR